MKVPEKLSFDKLSGQYEELKSDRYEWVQEWRSVSEYLLPGRGINQTYTKPRKRKLTTPKVINTIAEDALYILTSGMHGGLTSPSRPWFSLEWADESLKQVEPLKMWLEDSEQRLHAGLHKSNFYSIINSFYAEYAGFGTGCMYVGEDTYTDSVPFRFELLTAGEYAFAMGADGRPAIFFRTIFTSDRKLVELYPGTVDQDTKDRVENNRSGIDIVRWSILECIVKEPFYDKQYTRIVYQIASRSGKLNSSAGGKPTPLEYSGFYEFPYPVARWNTIGTDTYGIGPGARSLPDIKRLQEMEKAFLMATHKSINPPLNAPARMRGKLNTLPGGYNYYANPTETVNQIYQINFDYNGVGGAVERVEQRIQRNFFNDIFLTGSRDPNASPYKAAEVNAREQEKMLRLGPVIERLQHEFLQPIIERCFNIMLRKEKFAPMDPELAAMAGDYKITLVSPLATAQRLVALQGINSFLGFIGQVAQFDPSVLDNVDIDEAAREHADISGVRLGILRPAEDVGAIRQQRAEAEAEKARKEEAMAVAQVQSQMTTSEAQAKKATSEAGLNLVESQVLAEEQGF